MKQRIISGVILLALLLVVLFSNNFWLFWTIMFLAAIQTCYEYLRYLIFLTPNSPGYAYTSQDISLPWYKRDITAKSWVKWFLRVLFIGATFAPILGILLVYLKAQALELDITNFFSKAQQELSQITDLASTYTQQQLDFLNVVTRFISNASTLLLYCMFVWVVLGLIYLRHQQFINHTPSWLIAIFTACINCSFFYALIIARFFVVDYQTGNLTVDFSTDCYYFLYLILLVVAADSGAYFVGKSIGKHKLAPNISPNKTIEGLVGGLVSSLVISLLFSYFVFGWEIISPRFIIVSLIAALGSVHGDLVESLLKRRTGVKDSSSLIPGHGGILDRTDSISMSFTLFVYFFLLQNY